MSASVAPCVITVVYTYQDIVKGKRLLLLLCRCCDSRTEERTTAFPSDNQTFAWLLSGAGLVLCRSNLIFFCQRPYLALFRAFSFHGPQIAPRSSGVWTALPLQLLMFSVREKDQQPIFFRFSCAPPVQVRRLARTDGVQPANTQRRMIASVIHSRTSWFVCSYMSSL